jgi:hypothetical protein
MTTTVHNDSVGGQLAEAMMLLEMALDGGVVFPIPDLMAAAHSLVQSARGSHIGEPSPMSSQASALLASIHAASAIEDARDGRA